MRLPTLSKTRTVDLRSVISYKLLGVPLSIFHSNGEERKSAKSKLLHELEVKEHSVKPLGFCHDSATILDFIVII